MNQRNRVCRIQSHDNHHYNYICTFLECDQPTRWCCDECRQQRIHNHNKPNNSHVMKIHSLCDKLQKESKKFQINLDKQQTLELDFLEKIINLYQVLEKTLIEYIRIQKQNITQNQQRFKQYANNLSQENLEQLDDIKINELLKIKLQEFYQNQKVVPPDNIYQQLYLIESIIKDYANNQQSHQNANQIIEQKEGKYIIFEIDETNDDYSGSSISKNEQFLAYGTVSDKLLKIYDIKQKKIINELKLKNEFLVCQFTQDSQQLYVGLSEGYAYGYNVEHGFEEIFQQQIHKSHIFNIITIQNEYLITCSEDTSIIKTHIKSKQQIFKLNGHTDSIKAIDYNDIDEIIISGSDDKSIKLWNCRDQSIIINKEQSHSRDIRQIQLINNNLNILSLDSHGKLYKWKIDLINKDLIKLQKFEVDNQIFNFYQVNQDQNLLLICDNYVKILNQQGETMETVEHGGKDSTYLDCRQLDSLKYIQIRTQKTIFLAEVQD